MLKNYLLVALRTLRKQPAYSFINLAGLGVGVGCCLLILLFVRDEWSFDRFHRDADRLYRVSLLEEYGDGKTFFNAVTPVVFQPVLEDNVPEVEEAVRVWRITRLVRQGDAAFQEPMHLVDPALFEVFDFPLLQGDPASVLDEPGSVVLTETLARKYFGDESPVGRRLAITLADAPQEFLVTGVARDVPPNSSIRFDMALPWAASDVLIGERARTGFFNVIPETYVRLAAGTNAAALEARLPALFKRLLGDQYPSGGYFLRFQPITDIHLNQDFPEGIEPISDPSYSIILGAIALFVLAIACINFVTLSLGRSAGRAREVGMRKVLGARRLQLVQQFWGETLVITTIALLLGYLLAELALPVFNDLAGKRLTLGPDLPTLGALLGLAAVVGLAAGSYPALVLSGFRPIEVLKGRLQIRDASLFRRGLVVVQFALSIFLMISTLVMARQLRFLQTKHLGFDREQVVVIPTNLPGEEGEAAAERVRNALAGQPRVAGATVSAFTFGAGWLQASYTAPDGTFREFYANLVDADYVSTMGIEIAAGRDFSRQVASDEREGVLINEAFARAYGWANPVGQQIPGSFGPHRIIGVVKDFNFASLHAPVEPLVLVQDQESVMAGISDVSAGQSSRPKVSVRLRPGDIGEALALLERSWQSAVPDRPFEYQFLDEALGRQYEMEARLGRIVAYSTLFAILIACLGLFGLAALTVARRTKEIGIRKVMGASAPRIVVMLSGEFARLVVIALVVASPLAYLAMRFWLQDFAYRVPLGAGVFLLAGALAVVVALGTVSYQSVRAARADPVKSLRYE